MKLRKPVFLIAALAMGALVMGCFQFTGPALDGQKAPTLAMGQPGGHGGGGRGGGGGGGEEGTETAANNLSCPVIWADETMALGVHEAQVTDLSGRWVFWAGLDIDDNPVVYPSDTKPIDPSWKKAFLQQDSGNVWTADAMMWGTIPNVTETVLAVDLIDWGDNLESQDWTTTSKVRTEVVLYKTLPSSAAMNGYQMLHIVGRGVNEMHGLSVLQETADTAGTTDAERAVGDSTTQPIIYTNHARLTIQKLNFDRNDGSQASLLRWGTIDGKPAWVSADADNNDLGLVDAPLFNETVYDDATGPGGYSAEINIKGRIVYGYTWSPAEGGAEQGDYRLTFSLDKPSGAEFDDQTAILGTPEEVAESLAAAEEPTVGGNPVVLHGLDLTYIDIHLSAGGGGKGAGGGKGSGGGKGGRGGGNPTGTGV